MLTDEEFAEIDREIAESYTRQAACIPALRAMQRHRGWISDETLQDVAAYLEMTPSELENTATFYSLIFRHPVGRQVIAVCDSVVCWVKGAEPLLAYLEQKLGIKSGETTPDGNFTLIRIACLGDCDHAPCLLLNDVQVRDYNEGVLDRIIAGKYLPEGG